VKRAREALLIVALSGGLWLMGPWEGIRAGWHLGEWVVEWILNDTP